MVVLLLDAFAPVVAVCACHLHASYFVLATTVLLCFEEDVLDAPAWTSLACVLILILLFAGHHTLTMFWLMALRTSPAADVFLVDLGLMGLGLSCCS